MQEIQTSQICSSILGIYSGVELFTFSPSSFKVSQYEP